MTTARGLARLVAVVGVATLSTACGDGDLCGDAPGACVGVRVTDGPLVDQLHVLLDGAAHVDGLTPPTPGPQRRPPLTTAIYLPGSVAGGAELTVVGLRGGDEVARGIVTLTLSPGERRTVELALRASPGADLGADLAGVDLTGFDLAPPVDLTGFDLTPPPDLSPPPRYIFLLSTRGGQLGSLDALDGACSSEGIAVGGGNRTFRAVIHYPNEQAPRTRLILNEGRPIILPSGAPVATDSTFFTPTSHTGAIDELANGSKTATACVWSHFNANGDGIVSNVHCAGWTDGTSASTGSIGDPTTKQIQWTFSGTISCNLPCHVYCIEQPGP